MIEQQDLSRPQPYPDTRPKPGEGLTCNPDDDPKTWLAGQIDGKPLKEWLARNRERMARDGYR
jgi:hypothetical protein